MATAAATTASAANKSDHGHDQDRHDQAPARLPLQRLGAGRRGRWRCAVQLPGFLLRSVLLFRSVGQFRIPPVGLKGYQQVNPHRSSTGDPRPASLR